MREPEIKLFGRRIQLPDNAAVATGDESSDGFTDQEQSAHVEEVQFPEEITETKPHDKDQNPGNEAEESRQESDENPEPQSEQQKTLKKPDKILPCPRCSSTETKFCYNNNYNVNQPRHFCRSCQRYWTAGGTMRNVPVGSGRRKNKSSSSSSSSSSSHSHHLITVINKSLHASYNGTVLSFGPEFESMASPAPSFPEKRIANKNGDGEGSISCSNGGGAKEFQDCPNGVNKNGFSSPASGATWQFPWGPFHVPTFSPHPHYYWMPNAAWNIHPWLSVEKESPLGKRSINGEVLRPEKKVLEASIVVPKTLRVDDPEEAAKSSIWETLGIKYDAAQREGLFKALQPIKIGEKKSSDSSVSLRANPAALSRSVTFQEGA